MVGRCLDRARGARCGEEMSRASILIVIGLLLAPCAALAASSINTSQPVLGVPFNAAPIRQNFGAAAADIDALQSMNAGPSAPSNPTLGMLWLDTPQNQTLYTLSIWNDRQAQWLPIATLDSLNNLWITNVGGGLPVSLLADNTTDLGTVPQTVVTITGAGPVYSFGSTEPAGVVKIIQFTGATELIYDATSLILPGATDLTTDAGSMMIAVALGSGNWQALYYQTATLQVQQGGTGRSTLTAHAVLLGEGTSPVGFAVPGVADQVLLSTGASSDPAFGPVPAGGLSGIVPVANGGTGLSTLPIHGLLVGNDTSPLTILAPGTLGFPLVSQGASIDPAYQILNPVGGGTGQTTLPAHGVVLGEGSGPVAAASPGTLGYSLLSNGATNDPSFGQLNLAGAGITGILPIANLPFAVPGGAAPIVGWDGSNFTTVTPIGNLQLTGGNLNVIAGPTFTSLIVTGGITSSSIASSGTNTLSGTNALSGTTTIGGTLAITGTTTIGGGTTTLADTIDVTGDFTISAASGDSREHISGAPSQSAWSAYQTTGADRWLAGKDSEMETGSNAGSNYEIVRNDDTGTPTGIPLRIYRNSGFIQMGDMPTAGGGKNYVCIDPATLILSMSAAVCP